MKEKNSNRWKILIAVNLFTFMSVLDGSIVNIALPTMGKDLNIPMNKAEWVVSIYLIVICSFLVLFGKLADTFGKIRIFKIGELLFIIGSLFSGFNNNLSFLLFSRSLQAIGAAMTMSTNNGIITEVFPASERGQALGWVGSFVALGSIAGPGLGGLILAALPWGYIFWINVPVGIFAYIFGRIYLPKEDKVNKDKIDYLGFIFYFLGIILFFGAVFIGQEVGFSNIKILIAFIIAIILFVIFYRRQKSVSYPLINFEIFKNQNFSISLLCGFLIFVTNFFFNVISPFYLQNARGMDASHAGYVLMIFPVVQVIAAPFAGKVSDKVSPMMLTFVGLILIAISQASYATFNLRTPLWTVMFFIGLVGLGNGIFQAPNNSIIMSSVDKKYLGIAGGLNSLSRNVGMIIGISMATTILFSSMSASAGHKVTTYINGNPDIFITGMHVSFMASFVVCLLAIITTGIRWYKSSEKNK